MAETRLSRLCFGETAVFSVGIIMSGRFRESPFYCPWLSYHTQTDQGNQAGFQIRFPCYRCTAPLDLPVPMAGFLSFHRAQEPDVISVYERARLPT